MKRLAASLLLALCWATSALAQTCPGANVAVPPAQNYWTVADTNPTTQVFNGATGAYVTLPDATYTTWTGAGCTVSLIDTAAHLYAQIAEQARANIIRPTYSALTLSANTTLTSFATYTAVSPSANGWTLKMMNARLFSSPPIGEPLRFVNLSSSRNFVLQDNGGNTIYTVPANGVVELVLTDNSTVNGGWLYIAPQTAAVTSGTGSLPNPTGAGNLLSVGVKPNADLVWTPLDMSGGCTILSGVISCTSFGLSGNISAAAWTRSGIRYKNAAATVTDTTSSGTVGEAYTNVWPATTIAASNSTTFTRYYANYFAAPVAGTNVTITDAFTVGIGGRLLVNLNTSTPPAPSTSSTLLHLVGVDGTAPRMQFNAFASGNQFFAQRAGGTAASPSAVLNTNSIFAIQATGHDGSSYVASSRATIGLTAAQDWSSGKNGTFIQFQTTANDTATLATALVIGNDGGVNIGSGITAVGAGVLNVAATTAATSKTTGSLINRGGLGNSGALYTDSLISSTYMEAGTKLRATGSAPALTSCGTSPTIEGSDLSGTVTMGTGSPTGCVITFNAAYANAPRCSVTWRVNIASMQYAVSTTAITLTQTGTSSNVVDYICTARSGGWLLNRDLDPAANDNTPAFMEKAA
jgi:hypothetical protein